jgi:outer membrane protein assembly factor BamB
MKKERLVLFVFIFVATMGAFADNWPHYLGPDSNATSSETGILASWPDEGPKVLWQVPLGKGYGAPAVYDGKVYVLDREGTSKDVFRCYDLQTGKEDWNSAYEADGRFSHGGSRCVPSVNKERAYTIGPHGDVYCFDLKSKKPLWNKHIRDGYGKGSSLNWGFGQNALLYKNMVIVAPMAEKGGVTALDQVTGNVIWTSKPLNGRASYVSPSIYKIGGIDQVVMISAINTSRGDRNKSIDEIDPTKLGETTGLDPMTGKTLWTYKGFQCRIPIPNMVTIGEGHFFLTGGYEAGSVMIKISKKGDKYSIEELFKNKDFNIHCHPPVLYKDHLYAHCTTNERRDGMVCMDLNGTIKWKTGRDPVFDKGGFILVDNKIISVDGREGILYLIDPSPEGFKPISKVKILEPGEDWAPLTLIDDKLLIRDQTQMKCLQIK